MTIIAMEEPRGPGWRPGPPQRWMLDGEHELSASQIIELLGPYLTPARQAKIHEVVRGRTYQVVTVCEGLYDQGNVSAVMRSAESLGFQAMHIIQTQTRFKAANRVTMGADKWLDLQVWPEATSCVQALKAQGYRIAATRLDEGACPLSELDFTQPTALVFGNEHAGISQAMIEASDVRCVIPMTGFAQSFNISVAAALSLYHAQQDRLTRQGCHGDLSELEQRGLIASYYLRALKTPARLLRGVLRQQAAEPGADLEVAQALAQIEALEAQEAQEDA